MTSWPPLPDIPGVDAPKEELTRHHLAIGEALATRKHDDVLNSCMWCTRSDVPLPVNRRINGLNVTRSYCSHQCGDADAAHRAMSQEKVPSND